MADDLWGRDLRGGGDFCCRRASIHGNRGGAGWIFRRDVAKRSARPVDTTTTGTGDARRTTAPVGFCVAAGYRAIAAGGICGGGFCEVDGSFAAMDAI